MIRHLQQFDWTCDCGSKNIGWWEDAAFCECDSCGNYYSFKELEHFIEENEDDDPDEDAIHMGIQIEY